MILSISLKEIKHFISIILIAFVIVVINSTNGLADDLLKLAKQMATPCREPTSYSCEELFAEFDEQFENLSIDEKLKTIRLSRDFDINEKGEVVSIKEMNDRISITHPIDIAADLAAEDGYYLLDLTDEEIDVYYEKAINRLSEEEVNEFKRFEQEESKRFQQEQCKRLKQEQEEDGYLIDEEIDIWCEGVINSLDEEENKEI